MQPQQITNQVIELIAEQTGLDSENIEPSMSLEEDLGLTDVDITSLLNKINRVFEEVHLSQDNLIENGVDNVAELIQLVIDELTFA
ncbi:MAG TPA: DUF1493 family protein [Candidatus Woesebacteria bacterium]|jgi:acyl carrier protein|nr:DUF1493 family protein [Candidatus Woesebacteria bacterium]